MSVQTERCRCTISLRLLVDFWENEPVIWGSWCTHFSAIIFIAFLLNVVILATRVPQIFSGLVDDLTPGKPASDKSASVCSKTHLYPYGCLTLEALKIFSACKDECGHFPSFVCKTVYERFPSIYIKMLHWNKPVNHICVFLQGEKIANTEK